MATNYPSSLDTFDTIASDKKTSDVVGGRTHRDMHNDLADAVEAVQAELGTAPSGSYATVKARFEAVETNTLPTIEAKGDLLVGTADNTYDNLTVGANNTVLVADSGQTAGVKWASTVGVWTVAGLHVGYTAKTSAYTATTSDDVINVTSGTFTLDLPAASSCSGKTLKIRNSGTGVVTLDGNSSETVHGVATMPLGGRSYVEITSTGSAWILTAGVPDTGWRDISGSLASSWTATSLKMRRIGDIVYITGNLSGASASADDIYALPLGFRTGTGVRFWGAGAEGGTTSKPVEANGNNDNLRSPSRSGGLFLTVDYPTPNEWPTSLPGTAA